MESFKVGVPIVFPESADKTNLELNHKSQSNKLET